VFYNVIGYTKLIHRMDGLCPNLGVCPDEATASPPRPESPLPVSQSLFF
jgi:hypothetical protein